MHIRLIGAFTAAPCLFWGLFLGLLVTGGPCAGKGLLDEVRFGVFQHDSGIIGTRKERGTDFALEVLTGTLFKSRLLGSPRIVLGGAVNSARQTDQAYLGFTGQWTLARALFARRDAIYFEASIGGDWNDGKIDVSGTPLQASWKSHGSHFLIRSGASLGYRLNRRWSVGMALTHISNAGLAHKNEGMNDLGLVIGLKI